MCQRAQTLTLTLEEQEGLEVTMEMRERRGANRTQMSVHMHPLRLNHAGETSPESERHKDTLVHTH